MTENEQSLQKSPEQYIMVRRDQSGLTDSVEIAGFSVTFSQHLKRLNDVLASIGRPRTIGFNLEILPDEKNPNVDFMAVRTRPFKIELMGENLINSSVSNFTIRVTELERVNSYLSLSDIRDFTNRVFPNTELTLYAEPRFFEEYHGIPYRGAIPHSLYEEEVNEDWKRAVKNARSARTEEIETKGGFIIEDDLYTVVEEDITLLTRHPYYKFFEIRMEQQEEPVLRLCIPNIFGDNADCEVTRLYFRGRPQEIERVIEQFAILMEKVHEYPYRKERQKAADADTQDQKTPFALPERNRLTVEELLRRRKNS